MLNRLGVDLAKLLIMELLGTDGGCRLGSSEEAGTTSLSLSNEVSSRPLAEVLGLSGATGCCGDDD